MTLCCEIASWESLLRRRKAEHRFNLVVNRLSYVEEAQTPFCFSFCALSIEKVVVWGVDAASEAVGECKVFAIFGFSLSVKLLSQACKLLSPSHSIFIRGLTGGPNKPEHQVRPGRKFITLWPLWFALRLV